MKIIDLLNKIANGEEVPEKIKYEDYEYTWHGKEHGYCRPGYSNTYICFETDYYLIDILNDEVEIIEEDKKIEKLKDKYTSQISKIELAQKINEIIEVLNDKGR